MQDSGIVKEDRKKYLALNRCPLGNYEYNILNWCFACSQSTVSPKWKQENLFLSGLSNFRIDAIQAHEVLEQHKVATKVAERREVKKYEGARFRFFLLV